MLMAANPLPICSHPPPFKCEIKPRSAKAEAIIAQLAERHD